MVGVRFNFSMILFGYRIRCWRRRAGVHPVRRPQRLESFLPFRAIVLTDNSVGYTRSTPDMKYIKNVAVGGMLALGAAFFGGCEDGFQQVPGSNASVSTIPPPPGSAPGTHERHVVTTASAAFQNSSGSRVTISPGIQGNQDGFSGGTFNTKFTSSGGYEINTNMSWSGGNGWGASFGVITKF